MQNSHLRVQCESMHNHTSLVCSPFAAHPPSAAGPSGSQPLWNARRGPASLTGQRPSVETGKSTMAMTYGLPPDIPKSYDLHGQL